MQQLDLQLAGRLVTLRPFTGADITPVYIGWLSDPELMKFSNQRFRSHSAASCRDYLASFQGSDNLFLAITDDGQLVGTMTAYVSKVHQTADIGLLIGSQSQGKGFGKDAWETLMAYLFRSGIRKVTGGTLRCNKAMVRIMESAGMQPDGVRKGQELVYGKPEDILYFARFNSQCSPI
ncbi:GNAT family N-acetyltransferase [Candidatus Methylobacter oryzae]|uniref:GNAT family N-acetyltransferase n=1 Tax=Candidatus Methylobacter oryzae TaxID=2497749 RepID=A0ABY3CCG5_9GAMM|nr:GNAT family protein [Candidatus Methylobacter oryzae]TRW97075.1 GNAT family N-acetyltransferase [Candidatus Methylobacter oryzae]